MECIDKPNEEIDDIPAQSLLCLCIELSQVTPCETTEDKYINWCSAKSQKY